MKVPQYKDSIVDEWVLYPLRRQRSHGLRCLIEFPAQHTLGPARR